MSSQRKRNGYLTKDGPVDSDDEPYDPSTGTTAVFLLLIDYFIYYSDVTKILHQFL